METTKENVQTTIDNTELTANIHSIEDVYKRQLYNQLLQ